MREKQQSEHYQDTLTIIDNFTGHMLKKVAEGDAQPSTKGVRVQTIASLQAAFKNYLFWIRYTADFPECTDEPTAPIISKDKRVLFFCELLIRTMNGSFRFPSKQLSEYSPMTMVDVEQRGWPVDDSREDFLFWLDFCQMAASCFKAQDTRLKLPEAWAKEMIPEEKQKHLQSVTDGLLWLGKKMPALQAENAFLKENAEKIAKDKEEWEKEKETFLEENDRLTQEKQDLDSTITGLKAEKVKLLEQKQKASTECETLQKENEELKKENTSQGTDNQKLQEEVKKFNIAMAGLEAAREISAKEKKKLKAKIIELEAAAAAPPEPEGLVYSEGSYKYKGWVIPENLTPVLDSINKFQHYGQKISGTYLDQGRAVEELTIKLLDKLHTDLSEDVVPENFEKEFKELLHSRDKEMNTHCETSHEWGTYIGNILVACTIVGLFAIGIKYALTGHAFFTTQRMEDIENTEKEFLAYRKTV